MQDAPLTEDDKDPLNLRVLRILVTVLTVVMIVGLIAVVITFVTRFPGGDGVSLPDQVTLPEGVRASAVTMGEGWYAVVTDDDRILIFDRDSGELRQSVEISR
ncbi:DUF6476 family protein [Nioella sediminis]|jgi:hypothetical protein|uniref:DUF6476 family protein n=1 Tax=Nioella sediminis TaxID=1912092 RepID=UPI0008FD3598|nr:DUF6476 family protein [Nioella sediminis]TBX29126.1 hypothetical protein TK43_01910 [Roseovarius sp. JS7-11]